MLPQTTGLGIAARRAVRRAAIDCTLLTRDALERFLLRRREPASSGCETCEGIVTQKRMSVDTDLKAGLILEDLSQQLSDAVVDYQFTGGNHKFRIRRGDVTYQVDFPERVLLEHQIRDLERVVPRIVDQLMAGGAPRRITVGADTLLGTRSSPVQSLATSAAPEAD